MSIKTSKIEHFTSIEDMALASSIIVRPPERISVSQAAEKYRYVNMPGSYVGPWLNSTTPYMIEPMDECASLKFTGLIFVGPAQCAKPIALDTPIATPSGWSTMGDLKIGDEVFDRKGTPTHVTYLSPIKTSGNRYRITMDDGSTVVADGEHRWFVNDQRGSDPYALVVVDTDHVYRNYRISTKGGTTWRYRFSIPLTKSLELPDADLPLDPYLLGVWLGDGDARRGYLTIGPKDREHFESRFSAEWTIRELKHKDRTGITFAVDREDGRTLTNLLKEMGLILGKRIPDVYLRASTAQRRELLRGLMDTDGTVGANSRCTFTTSISELAEGFYELVTSLGIKAMRSENVPSYTYKGRKLKGKISYKFSFSVATGSDVFSLRRHIDRSDNNSKVKRETHSGRRFIRNVEIIEPCPVRCISVSSKTSSFLVGRQMMPTHNTDSLIINWLAYTAKVDPSDMMIVGPTSPAIRDFSIRRTDRLFRDSREIGACVLPGSQNKNVFDTRFTAGTLLTLSWPSIGELSGKPIPRLALTDYDRMPEDVDGEGNAFDLARKRATTFRRFGMTVAESTPGFEVENMKGWIPKTPHEAPPTKGILSLYNRGDRRRWNWKCPHCEEAFEPDFRLMHFPNSRDHLESAELAVMVCPKCGGIIPATFDEKTGTPGKLEMNRTRGKWIKDGQLWRPDGSISGTAVRSDIASFWLKGVCATFAEWKTLVFNYLKAMEEYERTGSQKALKTTVNVDQGLPYVNRVQTTGRLPENLKSRADDSIGEKVVPVGVRYLDAMIDIQKNRWEVQVHGVGVGGDRWVVDRFAIQKSERTDEDGEHLWVKPGTFLEDWKLLVPNVIEKTYPLGDGSGRRMAIKIVGCDSGGQEGATTRAYDFWRLLRDHEDYAGKNYHKKFCLLKGSSNVNAPRTMITFPDSSRRDRKAGARGEVPVLQINTLIVKDTLDALLDRDIPGGGKISFPKWLPNSFFTELTVESRVDGKWVNPKQLRNESWDCLCYSLAFGYSQLLSIEHLNWDEPPSWAAEWDHNSLVIAAEQAEKGELPFATKTKYNLADMGKLFG